MKNVLISVFLLLATACSTVSSFSENFYLGTVKYANKSDLKPGMSVDEVKGLIDLPPTDIRTFPAPADPHTPMVALEFDGALEEYRNIDRHWILFEVDRLVAEGIGSAREAEMYWYVAFFDDLRDSRRISRADAERKKYEKLQQLYPVTSYEHEYFTYRIVVAGKLDRGEIDDDTANYLLAQKKNEVKARIDAARQTALAREMIHLQRTALFLKSMSSIQSTAFTRSSTGCTTTRYGNTWYTNCY